MTVSKWLILLIFFAKIVLAEPIVPEGEVTNVLVTVHYYDTYEQMWEAFPDEALTEFEGISLCDRNVEKNIAWCDVHIVRNQSVDGEHTLTLGHEVLHGVFGNYHE
jgi:hypothetical protein